MIKKFFTYFVDMGSMTKYYLQINLCYAIMILSILFFVGFCVYSHYTFKKELQNYARKSTVIQKYCETIGCTTTCVSSVKFIRKTGDNNAKRK